jgi:hypothetical protein
MELPCLTISPGALSAFRWVGWTGDVWVCDICQPCIENARHMRRYYPEVKIKTPLHLDVRQAVRLLCMYRIKPIVDMDLAFNLPKAMPILTDVLRTLVEFGVHTKVLLTYVNHRDGFGRHANARRIKYLEKHLPSGVKYAGSHNYASGWSNEHHSYSKGSAMSVADIRT